MGTLTDMEAAADRLSLPERQELLRHFATTIRTRQADGYGTGPRADWMWRLAAFRAAVGPALPSVPGDQIVSELRGE